MKLGFEQFDLRAAPALLVTGDDAWKMILPL